ncbi:hypothetical protein IP92_02710 [Pseudoduganella flava]|uniref:Uncharacterized protein n=1 Tax=Pseudoduganella flava TaxID=871742 RepID=A0A562PU06_9BURK|nr:hypothetical protein [Pseudoduganella flava]QGZ39071.1 hypothetical protein GO485_08455 [Pseudoduganella flava]TWI47650.1 hypothetical protein IP92_02710 [Pseudoduganella flava]
METLKGIASNVHHGTAVTGNTAGDGTNVTTVHTTLLRIAGVQVRLTGAELAAISDGDRIAVAGLRSDSGLFMGLAYRNETTGVSGSEGWTGRLAVCAVLLAMGVWMASQARQSAGLVALAILAVWCTGIGWHALRSLRVRQAERTLREA